MKLLNLVISSLFICNILIGQGIYPNQLAPAPDSNMILKSKGNLLNAFDYEYINAGSGVNPRDSTTLQSGYGIYTYETTPNNWVVEVDTTNDIPTLWDLSNMLIDSFTLKTSGQLRIKQKGFATKYVNSLIFGGSSLGSNYLPLFSGNQSITNSSGTGFVKVTSGNVSYDNSTYFTLPSLTEGSVLFSNGSTISQDNSNFFWNNTNKKLGVGTSSPAEKLTIKGYQGTDFIGLNNELSANNRTFRILAGIGGITYNGFSIYDTYAAATRLYISNTGNVGIGNYDDTYKLSIEGTFQVKTRTGTAVAGAAFDGVGKLVQMTGLPPMGSGKPNKIAYWQNDTTLTYSNHYHIDATNRRLGINNSTPTDRLTITGYQTTDFIGLNNELSTNNRTFQLMAGYSGVGYNGFSIYDTYAAATRLHISNTGILRIPTLDTDLTAPTTSGTTKMVISDANGDLSFTTIPSAGVTGTGTNTQLTKWTGTGSIGEIANGTGLLYNNGSGAYTWVSGSLPGLTSGKLWIGNYLGVASERTISGDATISDMGVLTLSGPSAARGYNNSSWTSTGGSYTKVNIATQDFATGSVSLSTTNNEFTVGETGYYEMSFSGYAQSASSSYIVVAFYKNETAQTPTLAQTVGQTTTMSLAKTEMIYCTSGDKLSVRVIGDYSNSVILLKSSINVKKIR